MVFFFCSITNFQQEGVISDFSSQIFISVFLLLGSSTENQTTQNMENPQSLKSKQVIPKSFI
jgi:hypothetical protein